MFCFVKGQEREFKWHHFCPTRRISLIQSLEIQKNFLSNSASQVLRKISLPHPGGRYNLLHKYSAVRHLFSYLFPSTYFIRFPLGNDIVSSIRKLRIHSHFHRGRRCEDLRSRIQKVHQRKVWSLISVIFSAFTFLFLSFFLKAYECKLCFFSSDGTSWTCLSFCYQLSELSWKKWNLSCQSTRLSSELWECLELHGVSTVVALFVPYVPSTLPRHAAHIPRISRNSIGSMLF